MMDGVAFSSNGLYYNVRKAWQEECENFYGFLKTASDGSISFTISLLIPVLPDLAIELVLGLVMSFCLSIFWKQFFGCDITE